MPNNVERPTRVPMIPRNSRTLDALLDVVRQVEVRIVELVGGTLTLCVERTRANEEQRQQREREEGAENSRRAGPRSARHCHLVDQKFSSRLMLSTMPLAPTG